MSFLSRVRSTFSVSRASSIAFATVGTTVVTILVLPLLGILFDVLLGRDLGTPDLVRTAYAATLVGMGLGVCSGIVSKVATDRNLGIFQEVHQYRLIDFAYWIGSSAMPILLVLPTGISSLIVIAALSNESIGPHSSQIVVLSVCVLFVGALLGVSMAGFGVALSDPYQGASIAAAVVPILAGVIVPTAVFPAWMRNVSMMIPMAGVSRALNGIMEGARLNLSSLISDVGVGAAWACFGLIMVLVAVHRIRSGRKFSAI